MRRLTQAGFNLLELMMVVLITGVLLGVGIPMFTQFTANNRMAAATNDLVTSIHMARSEAVKRRTIVSICASADWNTDSPECDLTGGPAGWLIFADLDGDVWVDAGDTIVSIHGPVPDRVTFQIDDDSLPYIQFAASGFPRQAAAGTAISNIQLCDDRGDVATGNTTDEGEIAAGRWLQIGATGRPQLYRSREAIQGNLLGGC
ncbi:MAG: prepilin-type N-terminal cleavage/methylation domain-containing protein [Gammaproteobacteria bacterium]|nr:prepilin-type N-terminal cleavage/methylation domain-containing protein [Gammaproteobacteria bacterium]